MEMLGGCQLKLSVTETPKGIEVTLADLRWI